MPFIFAFSLTALPQLPFLPACAQPLCTLSRSSSPARLFSLIYFSPPPCGAGCRREAAGAILPAAGLARRWQPRDGGRALPAGAGSGLMAVGSVSPTGAVLYVPDPLCARPTVSHTELEAWILVYVSPLLAASHSPPPHQSSPSRLMSLLQKIRSSSHPCR